MKNKIALAAAFMAATSYSTAEIVINDFLSFEGFVDMSYAQYDGEIANIDESDNSFGIDQVEVSWLFDFDPVTAQVDFDYEDNAGSTVQVEQAFATYHLDNGGAVTAGRYDSMLGFEAFEPTGLYQYSTAYALPNFAGDLLGTFPGIGGDDLAAVYSAIAPIQARQAQGVKYTYNSDTTFFGISVQDGAYNYSGRLGGDDYMGGDNEFDDGGYGVEVAGSINFDNGFTWFAGGSYEDGDGLNTTNFNTGDTEAYILNTYVTYETGAWVFAGELSYGENEWDDVLGAGTDLEVDSLSALLMANFAYSEQASVTGRLSYLDSEADVTGGGKLEVDGLKYTLAHGYAFTDNLFLVTELSYTDGEVETNLLGNVDEDYDELLAAVELIFSF
jgi:hypothetical protein